MTDFTKIKYRFWDGEQMTYTSLFNILTAENGHGNSKLILETETVMPDIGLNDANGNLIYVRDICKGVNTYKDKLFVIERNIENCNNSYVAKEYRYSGISPFIEFDNLEVIGNMCENMDLLLLD